MAIIFDCVCVDILAILITSIIGIITYYKWAFKYWERNKVPYLQPSIPLGTMGNPLVNPVSLGELSKSQYEEAKQKGYKHVGTFILSIPIYMLIDPEYVKNIVARDFDHFVDRGIYYNEEVDPLSAHLFAIEGAKWRNLRMKITPTFTSGKMKMMFPTLIETARELQLFVAKISNEPLNIKDILGRFTTDVIGSCAFGLDCNSFEGPDSEFRKHLKRMFNKTKLENLKIALLFGFPKLSKFLGLQITPSEVATFIMGVVKNTSEFREKHNIERNDFMQLMLQLKNNIKDTAEIQKHDGKSLTMNELAAQAFVFLLAGYETSSTTMTFCLFELALNLDIQQKVRDELNSVLEKNGGNITYESLAEMKYLGQVIDETLRKYPPVPALNRKCVADYKIPRTDVTLRKGTLVMIPIIGLQNDPEYFPNPEEFDPERFSEENKSKINPYTYMPFGDGPRICIGLRFGIMQTKVGLAMLLKNYEFSVNTRTKLPVKFDPANFILSTLGDIWLNAVKV